MKDQYGTDLQNDVEVTITLGDNEGNLKVAFENENAVEVPMDNLEYYFQTHGLALLSDTQYTVTWNFGSDHEILSGDAYLLRIPVEPKSSFQLLVKDWVIFRGASTSDNPSEYDRRYYYINNNATFLDPGSNTRSIDKDYGVDYAIGKTVNTSTIQNGGILNYTIQVYQRSDLPRKAGLPVVDAVSGTQCLLAPVSENQSRPWAEKTQIYRASDGTEYYLLELPESEKEIGRYVYEGVWLNGDYADSVTVTALDKLKPEEAEKYNHTAYYCSIGNAPEDDGYLT